MSVLAIVAALGAAIVGIAPPASAAAGACAIAGVIDVSPGWDGMESTGFYGFEQVALACVGATGNPLPPPAGAGTMTGIGNVTSNGAFGVDNCGGFRLPPTGSFCGTYDATNFTAGGECHGTVGGHQLGSAFGGDWSLITGPLLLGGITCNSGSYAGGWGAIALVVVPVPTALDGQVLGTDLPPGECARPSRRLPTPDGVWFCQLSVAGVIVMQSVI
ncbi:MAG TPA: hypothetical protein VF230_16875 [Acidimicrobiales bacterium]